MATQHPDNAFKPYWLPGDGKFIDTKNEVEECFRSYSDLGCGEYMWDWEGKHVDEAVMEKLMERHLRFFSRNPLGKRFFLTFRVPNFWLEKGYRIARALVNIMSASDLAKDHGLHAPPVFETILPMAQTGRQLYFIRKKYSELAKALRVFGEAGPEDIELIPLLETPNEMTRPDKILGDYLKLCAGDAELRKRPPELLRPFVARSDPALNSGLVPAVLKAKTAIARCYEFEEKHGVPVYPIIGVGSLPFRGWLTPEKTRQFCEEYAGVRTVTVQPSFRYDHDPLEVKKAVAGLGKHLNSRPAEITAAEARQLALLTRIFESHYRKTIEAAAGDVNKMAKHVPPRRERRLHIGLFGYARSVGKKSLPRAIAFAGAMYSLGVPPELVGLGRGLKDAKSRGLLGLLEEKVSNLREIALFAGNYLNKQNLAALSLHNSAWKGVAEDVKLVEEWLGESLGPVENEHLLHKNESTNALLLLGKGKTALEEVERMAELRKSLG